MEPKVNYALVGLFVIVLSAALIIIFFWLSTFRNEKTYLTYLVYMQENVTGLSVQSPVRFSGVPVGYVKEIQLDKNNPQLVRLKLDIEDGTPITTGTVASLQFQGITGVLYVGLKIKIPGASPLVAKPGFRYPVIPSELSFIMQLSEVLPEVAKNIKIIGESIRKLLNEKNLAAIQKTLGNIAKASDNFPSAAKKMDSAFSSIHRTSDQLNVTSRDISTEVVPSAQQVLDDLQRTLTNLKGLSGEVERNPSIIIRGKAASTPGPGEK